MKPDVSIILERETVATEKRRKLTKPQVASLMLKQNGRCAAKGCNAKLRKGYCDDDHVIPLACGGTNHISNRQLLCPPCHDAKTNERDKGDAAQIARRQGRKGQQARRAKNGPKMKSRGFDRTLSKKFSGEVVRK